VLCCVSHLSLAGESRSRARFAARACTIAAGSLLFSGQVFEGKDLETMKDVAIKLVRKVSPRPPPSSPPAIGRPDTPNRQGALSLPCRGRYLRRVVLDRKGFGAKFVDLGGEGRIHSGNRQRVPDRALHIPPSLHKPCPDTMPLLLSEPPLRGRLPPQRAVPGTNPPRCSHRPGKKSVWTRHPPRSGGFLGSS